MYGKDFVVRRFSAACCRLWFVVVLGLISTAGAAAMVHSHKGVYYGDAQVLFAGPHLTYANPLSDGDNSLISTASVLQRAVSGANHVRFTSTAITLADAGVRHGSRVTLWNDGGQWNNQFDKPVLRVEAVGPTSRDVSNRMASLVTQINKELQAKQLVAGVAPNALITTRTIPAGPDPTYLAGDPHKALLIVLLLGLGLTATAVTIVDMRVPRRAADTEASRPGPEPERLPALADQGNRGALPVP